MTTLKFLEQVKFFMGMSHYQVTLRPMLTKLAWVIHLRMHGTRLALYSGSDLHFQLSDEGKVFGAGSFKVALSSM